MTIPIQHRTAHDGRDDVTPSNVVPIGGFTVVLEHYQYGRRTITVKPGDQVPRELFVQFHVAPSYAARNDGWELVAVDSVRTG